MVDYKHWEKPVPWTLYEDGTLVVSGEGALQSDGHGRAVLSGDDFFDTGDFDETIAHFSENSVRPRITSLEFADDVEYNCGSNNIYEYVNPLFSPFASRFLSEELENLDCEGLHLTFGEEGEIGPILSNLKNLKSLDFTGMEVDGLRNVNLRSLKNLEEFKARNLDWRGLSGLYQTFYELPNLQSVDMGGTMLERAEGKSIEFIQTFSECPSLTSVRLPECKGEVNLAEAFKDSPKLAHLSMAPMAGCSVTYMQEAFSGCSGLKTIYGIDHVRTSAVQDMNHVFAGCSSLEAVDLSVMDTSVVKSMKGMFANCESLRYLDLSGFDTLMVSDMRAMFYGCSGLVTLDIDGFDTANVSDMGYMFGDCASLQNVDLSVLRGDRVETMSHMFDGCSSIKEIDLSGVNTSRPSMDSMFAGCSSLESLEIPGIAARSNYAPMQMFEGCANLIDVQGDPYFQRTAELERRLCARQAQELSRDIEDAPGFGGEEDLDEGYGY